MTRILKGLGVLAGLAVVAGLVVALIHLGQDRAYEHRVDSIMGVERQRYLDSTNAMRDQLVVALVRDSARGDTIAKSRRATKPLKDKVIEADAAVVVADASGDSASMIRTRDETIAARDQVITGHERTIGLQADRILGLVGDGDSTSAATKTSVVGLFRAGRVADSSRIVQLEETINARPRQGWSLFGIRLACVAGAGAQVTPQLRGSLGIQVSCGPRIL